MNYLSRIELAHGGPRLGISLVNWTDDLDLSNRNVAYNRHSIHPYIDLRSETAWALAFEASRRRMYVADLIAAVCESWAEAWEGQLGETDRRRFLEYIPYSLGTGAGGRGDA